MKKLLIMAKIFLLALMFSGSLTANAATVFEVDAATTIPGVYKYNVALLAGDYSLTLEDIDSSFSWLGVTVGKGATNYGQLSLLGPIDEGVLNFSIATTGIYTALVFAQGGIGPINLIISSVPEPEAAAMLMAGLGLLAFRVRRKRLG
ncbi:PEP-CTERM sorting domain-containing protein [Methylobacillus gramineus]|uniref:PEP-CTERM sorting domain-containing protein n=1 Tax=Methylobacillus gramineus TaxID=755169 RepID=UPI001CFF54F2|nr:PEP-CTERM sorting domain-containing protein [Methylobacillus gramineus]MCB5183709.1 PEP-CTERM sorting domain-containing protein [Methylobacillus gramineus]